MLPASRICGFFLRAFSGPWNLFSLQRTGWKGEQILHLGTTLQVRCMSQGAQGWCTGTTLRDGMRREVGGGFRMGTHVHPWMIHVNVWQNHYSIVK